MSYYTGQSKFQSIVESSANTATGMLIAVALSQIACALQPFINTYLWRGFEWQVSAGSNLIMTAILTIVSITRSYFWRRYFNMRNKVDDNN